MPLDGSSDGARGLPMSTPKLSLPSITWAVIAAFAVAVTISWALTVATAPNLNALLMNQFQGASPVGWGVFLSLAGVMMVAMMLPSALPMLSIYRSVSIVDAGPAEGSLRSGLFASSYFVVWTIFAVVALGVLTGLGLMGTLPYPAVFIPGALLVAAGVYQFTYWKQFCLRQCRTPFSFVLTRWRSGRTGALRMGLTHSVFCVGCCWLLMVVVFVTGAMSLLWMGVFAGVVLAEKMWNQGVWFSRATGGAAVAVGAWILGSSAGVLAAF